MLYLLYNQRLAMKRKKNIKAFLHTDVMDSEINGSLYQYLHILQSLE